MKPFVKAILASVLFFAGISVSGAAPALHHGGHVRPTQHHGGHVRPAQRHGGHVRPARHHGGHARFGFYFGVPLFGPAYFPYYAPPYYYPPHYSPIVVSSPPVYIEQESMQPVPAPAALPEGWWYYCAESRAYYPYVKECPGDWQRVSPRPPNG